MPAYSLVYTSKATSVAIASSPNDDIDTILESARRRNSQADVCGALLVTEGHFVQVLEGEQADVQATFDRIATDPRHGEIEVLCAQTATRRRFSEWSMAFVGDNPALRQRYANAPLAALARQSSGDSLLDFMLEIVRSPEKI
jgi:hypothetical protein